MFILPSLTFILFDAWEGYFVHYLPPINFPWLGGCKNLICSEVLILKHLLDSLEFLRFYQVYIIIPFIYPSMVPYDASDKNIRL
jgi:hypothetical protein